MNQAHLNVQIHNVIRDLLLYFKRGGSFDTIAYELTHTFASLNTTDLYLILYDVYYNDHDISLNDVHNFYERYEAYFNHSLGYIEGAHAENPYHPLTIFEQENDLFEQTLGQLEQLVDPLEFHSSSKEKLLHEVNQLSNFFKHYSRKEQLYSPILEGYGIYTPVRIMWAYDDHIRTLFKGFKRMVEALPNIEFTFVQQAFQDFRDAFNQMIEQEKRFFLPMVTTHFTENDWVAIASESDAFGYAVDLPEDQFISREKNKDDDSTLNDSDHVQIGGGYLTIKEVHHLLNHLPLELTFIDRYNTFKYFNQAFEASEMVFTRTPISIGRNVANCHPPKSKRKVMQLVRELKAGVRFEETMWFKKGDQYIHITYKAIFDDNGHYLGILEYVQDIQPFFDLPNQVKKGLSS